MLTLFGFFGIDSQAENIFSHVAAFPPHPMVVCFYSLQLQSSYLSFCRGAREKIKGSRPTTDNGHFASTDTLFSPGHSVCSLLKLQTFCFNERRRKGTLLDLTNISLPSSQIPMGSWLLPHPQLNPVSNWTKLRKLKTKFLWRMMGIVVLSGLKRN